MKLPLTYYGDPLLRQKGEEIGEITPEIVQLAHDMIETMRASNGVGIAAPQVGKSLRLFIICDEKVGPDGEILLGEPEVILNPTLTAPSQESASMVEGCLSIPGVRVEVVRPLKIQIRYQNLKGEWIEEEATDFRARVIMHENDHINGVLMIDRTSEKERRRIEPLLKKIKKRYHRNG